MTISQTLGFSWDLGPRKWLKPLGANLGNPLIPNLRWQSSAFSWVGTLWATSTNMDLVGGDHPFIAALQTASPTLVGVSTNRLQPLGIDLGDPLIPDLWINELVLSSQLVRARPTAFALLDLLGSDPPLMPAAQALSKN
jgi:hypothetical protein